MIGILSRGESEFFGRSDPRFLFSPAFRSLRTSILLPRQDLKCRGVIVLFERVDRNSRKLSILQIAIIVPKRKPLSIKAHGAEDLSY